MRTVQQVLTYIANNITDALLRQNTALRVRNVFKVFATDYFNKESDTLAIEQVDGLRDELDRNGGGRPPAYKFKDEVLLSISYLSEYPPLSQVFDDEGNLIICPIRIDFEKKILEFNFSEPTSGIIIF
jgi:hypothetical protein